MSIYSEKERQRERERERKRERERNILSLLSSVFFNTSPKHLFVLKRLNNCKRLNSI